MFFESYPLIILDREAVGCMTVVLLTGLQGRLCPLRMVGTVGVFLALQTYADVLGVFLTMLAEDIGILAYTLEISAIYLSARFVGVHLHEDACLR